MSVEVEDLTQAQARGLAAIEGLGGFVADEQTSFGEAARSTISYRIPAESYSAAVQAIADVGEVVDQTRQTEDVTEQLVDLQSRLTTARASVERLRSFFEQAGDLTQVALLEGELLKRETEVETLTAGLRAMEDRVSLSTLVVTWQEPIEQEDKELPVAAADQDELPTFLDGLSVGWTMLLRGGQVAGAALGLALPFAPVALVALGLQRAARRLTSGGRRRPNEAPA
jgi:hypothetical protein